MAHGRRVGGGGDGGGSGGGGLASASVGIFSISARFATLCMRIHEKKGLVSNGCVAGQYVGVGHTQTSPVVVNEFAAFELADGGWEARLLFRPDFVTTIGHQSSTHGALTSNYMWGINVSSCLCATSQMGANTKNVMRMRAAFERGEERRHAPASPRGRGPSLGVQQGKFRC